MCGLTFLLQIEAIHGLIRFCTLQDSPTSQQFLNAMHAIRSREQAINIKQFELTLHERINGSWRELDNLTPHDNHHSSRIMRTCHTHFGEPLGIALGWWDDRKSNHKPVVLPYLPSLGYFQPSQPCALSCLRLSGHNFLVQKMRHNRNRRPYELRICDKCDWHSVQDEEHILLTVRMNTLLTFAHSTTSCSSHLNMKIAQIV